jgi:predicted permease
MDVQQQRGPLVVVLALAAFAVAAGFLMGKGIADGTSEVQRAIGDFVGSAFPNSSFGPVPTSFPGFPDASALFEKRRVPGTDPPLLVSRFSCRGPSTVGRG